MNTLTSSATGEFYWYRVTSFAMGAAISIDGRADRLLDALIAEECPSSGTAKPWKSIKITGSVVMDVGDMPGEKFPGPVTQQSPDALLIPSSQSSLAVIADVIAIAITGGQFATVKFGSFVGGGVPVTAEYSKDGGTNWLPAPYATLTTTVNPNPTVQAIAATVLNAGDVWEAEIPANITNYRLRATASGISTPIFLNGARVYEAGIPITAVLFDVTQALGVDNPTGIMDFSGWYTMLALMQAGGAVTTTMIGNHVFDDGLPGNNRTFIAAATSGEASFLKAVAGTTSIQVLSKRMQFDVPVAAGQQTRLRIEVGR